MGALDAYVSPAAASARLVSVPRRLTLPSSGPAYGGPLKSNVRPLRSLRLSRSGNSSSRPAQGNGALLDLLA